MNRVFRFPRRVLGALSPIVARPPVRQVAALCLRTGRKGPEVLMITSRGTGRWIIPKGWPIEGKTASEAALQEAWEEAGVEGTVNPDPLGDYRYRKEVKGGIPVTCRCEVFRVDVDALADDWPERGRRQREWVTPREAAKRVEEPELKAILREIGS